MGGTERGARLIGGGITTLAMLAVSVVSFERGGGRDDTLLPVPAEPDGGASPSEGRERGEAVFEALGRTLRRFGERATDMRERAEGLVGLYRIMKALGMNEAEIAGLVARQGAGLLNHSLDERAVSASDARRVVDGLQELVLRAAEDVDQRLDLHGDLVRPVRGAVTASRAGREDAIAVLDRGVTTGRDTLRRTLIALSREEKE